MELVFATHNSNKIQEIRPLLPAFITLLSLQDIGCTEEIQETENTLEDNALLKAKHVLTNYNYPCFADDTGLLVDALNGAPGVYSARYAGNHKSAEDNMNKLLQQLQNTNNRSAHFRTVIALQMAHTNELFSGTVMGDITTEKRGKKGFGYDPIFKPKGYHQTFAELPLSEKNKISHRAKALSKLISYLKHLQ